ncbi:hypothetical protein [Undibacterium pigrum]|uniref:hypothetical protein n=1 Tax=Undibacterium pigrum TaxID=401470 RepID=UPI0014752F0D|nr:hypothetical protein [Undibacterium pigrum]
MHLPEQATALLFCTYGINLFSAGTQLSNLPDHPQKGILSFAQIATFKKWIAGYFPHVVKQYVCVALADIQSLLNIKIWLYRSMLLVATIIST